MTRVEEDVSETRAQGSALRQETTLRNRIGFQDGEATCLLRVVDSERPCGVLQPSSQPPLTFDVNSLQDWLAKSAARHLGRSAAMANLKISCGLEKVSPACWWPSENVGASEPAWAMV